MPPLDPVELSQALMRCRSVTPADDGALDVVEGALKPLGFECHRITGRTDGTPDIDNIYARLGTAEPNLCFAGHTDVVPPGDETRWSHPPFAAEIHDGILYGRGAVDMKTGTAAFIAATSRFVGENGGKFPGSISFLITGDEEGPSINGTLKVLEWMTAQGETMDACIIGEPTNTTTLGETIKNGRRGSINGFITQHGTQGHVAYPHYADNPAPKLIAMLHALNTKAIDQGTEFFEPSNLEITMLNIDNTATNIIPNSATAGFNIRFNSLHSPDDIKAWVKNVLNDAGDNFDLEFKISGDSFITEPGHLTNVMSTAITKITGLTPELSTGGGTSDARFIKDHCAVAEFGLMNQTAHKIDECVATDDIRALTDIYVEMLNGYFNK